MTNQGEMTVSGTIKAICPGQQVSATYNKREIVVTTDEQYPQHILIEFSQGKCKTELDKMEIGTNVIVSINLKGREWVNPQGETKYFNTIHGWKISQRTA